MNIADIPVKHVYIHVPFCLRKCAYCSFYSVTDLSGIDLWQQAVEKEIELMKDRHELDLQTIYFGGGTPSLIKPEILDKIISQLSPSNVEEITIEINPINVTANYLEQLKNTPINRISMGVQSFQDFQLELLGRLHNSSQAIEAFKMLKTAGYQNISLDLIYGLPDQNINNLKDDLEQMINLSPAHISLYCLSLESNVPLYQRKEDIPDDSVVAEMYKIIRERLKKSDYLQYEISNFSKKGYHSRHNSAYWEDRFYLGIGPSAAGYLENYRYNNAPDLNKYCKQIAAGRICTDKDIISEADHKKEFVFLGLRKTAGIKLSNYYDTFNEEIQVEFGNKIRKYLDLKMLILEKGFLKLSPETYFVSDEIFADLI